MQRLNRGEQGTRRQTVCATHEMGHMGVGHMQRMRPQPATLSTTGAPLNMDAALVTKQHVQQLACVAAAAAQPYLLQISLPSACEADVAEHCTVPKVQGP
jgi:hypothetical protein